MDNGTERESEMKGIREFTNAKFAQLLPELGTLGNTGFRKSVMEAVVNEFSISVASAATHYNHSLKVARFENPKAVESLGRPEDKKGGRRVLHGVSVIKVKTGEVVATGVEGHCRTDDLRGGEVAQGQACDQG